jgi:hypothetical protein
VSGSPRSLPILLRDAAPVAAVALLVFQGLRLCVAERYVVPTASMAPTLRGDPLSPDVVLVEKVSAWSRPDLRRYDLVVVQSPVDPHRHLVKRAVAFGDDRDANCLRLEDGDLWLGPDASRLRRVQKDPLADRDLRVTWFAWPQRAPGEPAEQFLRPGGAELLPDRIVLRPVELERGLAELTQQARRHRLEALPPRILPAGFCGLARSVDSTWLEDDGRRGGRESGQVQVNDFGAELEIEPGTGLQALVLALELRPHGYAWIYRADGSVQFLRDGGQPDALALRGPALRPGTRLRLEYGCLDDRLFLIADDRVLDARARPGEGTLVQEDVRGGVGRGQLCFAAVDGPAEVRSLRVFRDLYWFLERVPFRERREQEVPPGHVYLLGDNSFDSQDSRSYGPLPLTSYVGSPICVLGPWPRLRRLYR